MAKYPDSITIEFYNGSTWVDISSYVVSDLTGNQGFENQFDRVAYLGLLELELNNVNGLFMPMGGDSVRGLPTLTGFSKGSKIRVKATVGIYSKVIWTGRIDSLDADDNTVGEQRVRLLAVDWFDVATRFPMKGSDILLNKNLSESMEALLARISIQPESTDIDTGTVTFPAVFEDIKEKTKAISEINKLTLSELGYTYLLMDGTLRVEDSSQRKGTRALDEVPVHPDELSNLVLTDGSDFLLVDGSTLLLDELEEAQLSLTAEKLDIVLKDSVINRADVRAYPVRTATSLETVFKLGSPLKIPAGQTITFTAHYVSSSGENIYATNQQTPVATTDYLMNTASDGSGTNQTGYLTVTAVYYGDVVEYTLTSSSGADCYVTFLQARGYGIYYDSPISTIYEDEDSINSYGETVSELEQKYKRNLWDALAYAKSTVEEYKTPKLRVTSAKFNANVNGSHLMAFLYLDIGSLISIYENKSEITKHYYIISRSFTITRGKVITVTYGLKENLSYLSNTLTPVSVDFANYSFNSINYGSLSKTGGLTQRSISAKVYPRTVSGRILYSIADNAAGGFSFALGGTNKLQFYQKDDSLGSWDTDDNSITANAWHHLVITRDRSIDINSDPIIYIDGVVAHITETSTPSATYISSEEGLNLRIGSTASNGIYEDVRMYDRILTQAEVTELYNNNAYANVVTDGMVFQSHFINSDYQDSGDGNITTNLFDNIYKAVGVSHIPAFSERSWALKTTPNASRNAVAWSPALHLFAAVGNSGTKTISVSSDSFNWNYISGTASETFYSVCWSDELGLFVAVGDNAVRTSTDGQTWTSRTPAVSGKDWRDVCYSPELNLFVAVNITGTAGQEIMTSPDGVNWTVRSAPTSGGKYKAVTWSPESGLFVAVRRESSGNRIAISSDGINWTNQQAPSPTFDTTDFWDIVWSPELGIFVATAGNLFVTSVDGINWTQRTAPAGHTYTAIEWSPELGIFLAVSYDGTGNRSMYSTDGITWNSISTPADYGWYGICYSKELQKFVAVQNDTSNTNRVMTF